MSLSRDGWLELESVGSNQATHLYGQILEIGTLWQIVFPVPFILQRIQKEAPADIHHLTPLLRDVCTGTHPEVEVAMATAPLLDQAPAKMEGFKAFGSWGDLIDSLPSYSFETHAHALAHSSPTNHAALDRFLRADHRQVNYPSKSAGHFFIIFGLASVSSVFYQIQQEARADLLQRIGSFADHSLPLPSSSENQDRLRHSTTSLAPPSTEFPSLAIAPSLLSLSPSPFYQPLLLAGPSVGACDESKLIAEQAFSIDDGTIVRDSEATLSPYLEAGPSILGVSLEPWAIRAEGTLCEALSAIGGGPECVKNAGYCEVDEVLKYGSALDLLQKAGAEFQKDGLPSPHKGLIIGCNYHSYFSILEDELRWPTQKWVSISSLHAWAQALADGWSWSVKEDAALASSGIEVWLYLCWLQLVRTWRPILTLGFKPINQLPTAIQNTLSFIRYDHLQTIKDFQLFDPYLVPSHYLTGPNP
ncbi:hypothetical protein VNI00_018936 [Paramarasmius palmivorus]|uniref:Uncharacterized protein n=1 Tax=Paramarasmius palmivorus TaxID=297713 RepID=A0AAW0ATE2_9AGAR